MSSIANQLEPKKISTRGFASHPENINRKGPSVNPRLRRLESALKHQGKVKGTDYYEEVAKLSLTDKTVMLAVLDKLIANQHNPKEDNESAGIKQLIIIRPEHKEANDVSRQVYIQSEEVSGDVVKLGNGENNVLNLSGNVIQRASTE